MGNAQGAQELATAGSTHHECQDRANTQGAKGEHEQETEERKDTDVRGQQQHHTHRTYVAASINNRATKPGTCGKRA